MEGWIKLSRKITKHWIWSDPKYLMGWVYCLLRANHEPNKVLIGTRLIDVRRGEFITSRDNFAKDTSMSPQMVRTFWALLEKDKMINRESTSTSTKIIICNYDLYQDVQPASNQQTTSGQPAVNQRSTTDKNDKKEKNDKKYRKFVNEIWNFKDKYPEEMLRDFLRYWGEWNKSETKMRWELQPTWQLSGRLATWLKRARKDVAPGYDRVKAEPPPPGFGEISPTAISREEYL